MKKTTPFWVAAAMLLGCVQWGYAQQIAPARGSQPVQRQLISATEFSKMTPEQQNLVKANPQQFDVEGVTQRQIYTQAQFDQLPAHRKAYVQANPHLFEIKTAPCITAEPTNKIRMTRSEYLAAPADKRAHIDAHAQHYEILD